MGAREKELQQARLVDRGARDRPEVEVQLADATGLWVNDEIRWSERPVGRIERGEAVCGDGGDGERRGDGELGVDAQVENEGDLCASDEGEL